MQTELDFDFNVVEYNLKENLQLYINSLAPSEPLYISNLVETSKGIDGLLDVVFYKKDSTERLENIYTRTPRSAIRIQTGSINITNVPS